MSVISKLASVLGHRDDIPNQQLAQEIVDSNNKAAVRELVENLGNKNKGIKSDCVKTLYEIGERNPKLLAPHASVFIELLDSKDNRMQWGAMTAINTLTLEAAAPVYQALAKLVAVADKGSVITKDHCVGILIKLAGIKEYAGEAYPLLTEQIQQAAVNQLPRYAEDALPVVPAAERAAYRDMLVGRLSGMEEGTKKTRLEKVIKKLNK